MPNNKLLPIPVSKAQADIENNQKPSRRASQRQIFNERVRDIKGVNYFVWAVVLMPQFPKIDCLRNFPRLGYKKLRQVKILEYRIDQTFRFLSIFFSVLTVLMGEIYSSILIWKPSEKSDGTPLPYHPIAYLFGVLEAGTMVLTFICFFALFVPHRNIVENVQVAQNNQA